MPADFGHILGNTLVVGGVFRRERTRFVLSKEMSHVLRCMGKDPLRRFEELCVRAFLELRRHASLLAHMLLMLVPGCLPELNDPEDLEFVTQMLQLTSTEDEAAQWLREQLAANFGRATAFFKQVSTREPSTDIQSGTGPPAARCPAMSSRHHSDPIP